MEYKYEGIFIIKLSEEQDIIKKTVEEINEIVKRNHANIYHKDEIGVKKLAYEIKNNKKGFFYLVDFETNDKNCKGKIETNINILENVIKFMIIKLED